MNAPVEFVLREEVEDFVAIMNEAAAQAHPADLFGPCRQLSGVAAGHLLLQWLSPGETLSARDKMHAVHVAEVLGPDYAQKLYHFAVMVTRLA